MFLFFVQNLCRHFNKKKNLNLKKNQFTDPDALIEIDKNYTINSSYKWHISHLCGGSWIINTFFLNKNKKQNKLKIKKMTLQQQQKLIKFNLK